MKNNILEKLIVEALKSEISQKHAAAIIVNGKIVSIEHNIYIKSFNKNGNKFTIHAEANAIINLPRKYKFSNIKKTLYVIRVSKEGFLKLSKPCDQCCEIIEKYNIHTTYYS